jgi:hypothetical protein
MRGSKEQVLLLCVLLPILYRQNKKGQAEAHPFVHFHMDAA